MVVEVTALDEREASARDAIGCVRLPPSAKSSTAGTLGRTRLVELTTHPTRVLVQAPSVFWRFRRKVRRLRRVGFCGIVYFERSSRQTAVSCIARSRASSSPLGAGMLSVLVTARRPSRVAAANCT
jgi:hypothetical protein